MVKCVAKREATSHESVDAFSLFSVKWLPFAAKRKQKFISRDHAKMQDHFAINFNRETESRCQPQQQFVLG